MAGENFHFVGQTINVNPISPPPPPSAYGTLTPQAVKQGTSTNETVTIDIEEGENSEANRAVKKRYWTHDEETRLVTDQFLFSLVCNEAGNPIYLICSYFFISYFVGQCLVECFKRPS